MPNQANLNVMVLGVRGIPAVQGGVETHAEQLYPRLAELGCDVEVVVRTPFVPKTSRSFGPIRLRRIWSPKTPGLEALVHSVLGALYAGIARPDVLHIHAIGPSIVAPLARLLGLRVVVTHHGPDYDRDKWNAFARWVLRSGERAGMVYANQRIVISKVIASLVMKLYGEDSVLIPNGVRIPRLRENADELARFGLEPGRYFLQVSRMVPEKRQLDLIRAFKARAPEGWQLALVGGLDTSAYSSEVREAARDSGVVLTDFLSGEPLAQLYSHAGVFVLPSSHEGLPIAMLEALSYGLPVLASDIPANLEVNLEPGCYFPMGNIPELTQALQRMIDMPMDAEAKSRRRTFVGTHYDWNVIAEQTMNVYRAVCGLPSAGTTR